MGICLVGAAISSRLKWQRRWIFGLSAIFAICLAAIVYNSARDGLVELRLVDAAKPVQKAQAEQLALDNASNLVIRMRSGEWNANADRVKNEVTVFIPLENSSQKLVGTLLVGCRVGSPSYIYIYLTLANNYQMLDMKGVKPIAFLSPQYPIGFQLVGNVAPSSDGNSNTIHIQGISGANEQLASTNEISHLKAFLRRVHENKNFQLIFNADRKGESRSISIKEPVPTLDANNKLFETTAAYCLNAVPD